LIPTASTAITASTASLFLWPCFVHRQSPSFEVFAIEHGDRLGRVCLSRHLDKGKATGPTCFPIQHEVYRSHRTGLGEQVLQVVLSGVIGEIPNVYLCAHGLFLPLGNADDDRSRGWVSNCAARMSTMDNFPYHYAGG
jgi:hypothetical protein